MKPIPEDTIAAIATPLGEGGLAMIRLSGADALAAADRVFRPAGARPQKPSTSASHTIHYGHVLRGEQVVDEVLLSVLRAPRTFTREDVVEISCHGGILAAQAVLEAVLAAGARLAEPGEFTKRAFLNGRLDLAQAEAVADLIHARTELALVAANEQLAGHLSRRIDRLREDLMRALAHVEAQLDFPEEDIAPDTREQLLERMHHAVGTIENLLRTAREGQILRRGVRVAIIGRANVGKSSLLNQLLGHDRAIVTPIPGTTRDTIEETASIRGLPVVFIDTAGLRESDEPIEQEGIRRSHLAIERADLILQVLDHSQPFAEEDRHALERFAGKQRILVRNKTDLPGRLQLPVDLALSPADVSARTGDGMDALKDAIRNTIWSGEIRAEMLQVAINARHQDALRRAREAAQRSRESLQADRPLEFVALDLRIAVNAVGEVVGRTTTEDLLDQIFREFCIGK